MFFWFRGLTYTQINNSDLMLNLMKDPILYKYLDPKGAKLMLEKQNLQYTNATYFNDPFDCHPALINCNDVPENVLNWPPSSFLKAQAENELENLRIDTWISCLSKRFDNPLMWGYYTKHKGVCIGLNRGSLARYINASLGFMAIGGVDVEYCDLLQRPDYFRSFIDVFHYQLCTKGKQWAHEEEVRFAIIKPSVNFVSYSLNRDLEEEEIVDWKEVRFYPRIGLECFNSIYLGCRMPDKEKEEMLQLVKNKYPEMAVYQMEINPDRFGFDAVPIAI